MALQCIKAASFCVRAQKTRAVSMTGYNLQTLSNMSSSWCQKIHDVLKRFYSGKPTNYTVAVEGNIGSGKTSLLQYFSNCSSAQVLQEPVQKWRDIDGHNALELMYRDPTRWSLTFQTYVQLTMLEAHLKKQEKSVKLMERSIYSAKYCFAENLHTSGKMPDIEAVILTKWFDWIVQNNDCHLDLIVYLQTEPEVVHERIKKRCRKEEEAIPLDYLKNLHTLHEDWLVHQTKFSVPCPVLILDANEGPDGMVTQYESNKDHILYGSS